MHKHSAPCGCIAKQQQKNKNNTVIVVEQTLLLTPNHVSNIKKSIKQSDTATCELCWRILKNTRPNILIEHHIPNELYR